jgi:hypothetical protein
LKKDVASSNLDPETKRVLDSLVSRIDNFIQDLFWQLNETVTIYRVDPDANPDDVEGARPGDVCIYRESDGPVQVRVFE